MLHERVAQAVEDGADLDEVEASVIVPAALAPEERDALWLYAWGLLERDGTPVAANGHRFSRR